MICGKSAFTLGVYETNIRHASSTFTFKCGMPGFELLLYLAVLCYVCLRDGLAAKAPRDCSCYLDGRDELLAPDEWLAEVDTLNWEKPL